MIQVLHVTNVLEGLLKFHLMAAHQYRLHAAICKTWGYHKLAQADMARCNEKLINAGIIMDRILFLGAFPNINQLPTSYFATNNIEDQLDADLNTEHHIKDQAILAINNCIDTNDWATRAILEKIAISTDQHIGEIETQQHLVQSNGRWVFI